MYLTFGKSWPHCCWTLHVLCNPSLQLHNWGMSSEQENSALKLLVNISHCQGWKYFTASSSLHTPKLTTFYLYRSTWQYLVKNPHPCPNQNLIHDPPPLRGNPYPTPKSAPNQAHENVKSYPSFSSKDPECYQSFQSKHQLKDKEPSHLFMHFSKATTDSTEQATGPY